MNEPSPDFKARLLALFNENNESDRLVELLDPHGTNSFTKAAVETILAAKKIRPKKRFTTFAQIRDLFTNKTTLNQFNHAMDLFLDEIRSIPRKSRPVLLLPVRLETRFTSDKLLVRIYPDQISIHSHVESSTPAEYDAAKAYRAPPDGDLKHAWRILTSKFGPARASWIARWAEAHDFDSNDEVILSYKNIRMPQLAALPDEYWVFAYQGSKVTAVKSKPVQSDSAVLGDFDNLEEGLFDERSKWMHDFEAALNSGFAVEIPLSPDLKNGCDRLIVVGLKRAAPDDSQTILEKLIDAHHYSSGLGFVEPGTPTNNTDEVRSSFSSHEDHDISYGIEIQGPSNWETLKEEELQRTNAHRLAAALGIAPERLRYLEGSGSRGSSYAAEMNTILWTVTGEYYFNYLLSGILTPTRLKKLRKHVRDFVWGGGTLPAIRVGRQPYGVLPVTRISDRNKVENGWSFWDGDSNAESDFDPALHRIVSNLYKKWLIYAQDHRCVPRVGVPESDPDETLLRILSMEPNSISYQARPYVDEGFIALLLAVLRDYVFGPDSAYRDTGLSPEEWMAEWAGAWDQAQQRIAEFLSDLSGLGESAFFYQQDGESGAENATKQLLKILGWGKGEQKPIEMVKDPQDDTSPPEYLAEIYRSTSAEPNTLLGQMVLRALRSTQQSPDLHKEIKDALRKLSSLQVLDFFNTASDAEQIVQQIEDDPAFHPERDGYGVRFKLAARILEKREQLGGQFTSIEQIDEVYRVGVDTMHDILYSFREDKAQVDIARLFSESLDIASHRVDAWVTSFAAKRLKGIRERRETSSGIYLGAYGFVEDLQPRGDSPTSAGYIHAPSAGQAAAGAILFNAFLTHDPKETVDNPGVISDENPFHINLTSERVRKAMRILEGIRQGQPLGALLGFQFERALRDHAEPLQQYIHDFRESFPLVAHKVTPSQNDESGESVSAESVAARNVADGVAIIRDFHGEKGTEGKVHKILASCPSDHRNHLVAILNAISNTLDAVGDILLHESVYQSVQGNFERAGAVLEAASGNLPPPELESIKTEVPYRSMHCLVGMLFNETLDYPIGTELPDDPRGAAEPRVAAWFDFVLGPMGDIGIVFEFWEEETDADILSLTNVNTATQGELDDVPEIGKELAWRIIQERSSERGPFHQVADLLRVSGIGKKTLAAMRPYVTTGYVERVDINTASDQELRNLAPITKVLADKIIKAREVEPFTCIDDLINIVCIDKSLVDEIRAQVTTGRNNLSLDKCGLSSVDFLYIAQVPTEGDETELEQRLARFVRDDHGLPASQRVVIHAEQKGAYSNSLADAVELSRSALDLLSTGTQMSPDTMCHPEDIEVAGYCDNDVHNLGTRVEYAQAWLDEVIAQFNGIQVTSKVQLCLTGESGAHLPAGTRVRHRKTNTIWKLDHDTTSGTDGIANVSASTVNAGPPIKIFPLTEWEIVDEEEVDRWKIIHSVSESIVDTPRAVTDLLARASRFGVPGAFPTGVDDPHLIDRFENTREELKRRTTACQRHIADLNGKSNNAKIDLQCKGMKAIFGKSFVVLPTFVPHQPEDRPDDLSKAFKQDILNSLGEERLRLWLQQLSEVREPLSKFETSLMMIEAWSQASAPISLNLAQLPYTEGRNWLGLSIEEGAESAPDPLWIRSPLSVVVTSHGELPDFSSGVETAGIIIDELIDRIPEPNVATSIAYQYDAPGTQAPQALLLAVSGQMGNGYAVWTHEELAAIVNDTIDLAKVRAVDTDALAEFPDQPLLEQTDPVGGILPGIYLPTDPDQPDWVRETLSKSIREWIDELEETLGGCVTGILNYPILIGEDGITYHILEHPEWEMNLYARGIDNPALNSAIVCVKGYIGSASNRIFVTDYTVVEFPENLQPELIELKGLPQWETSAGETCLTIQGTNHSLQGGLVVEISRIPALFSVSNVYVNGVQKTNVPMNSELSLWGHKIQVGNMNLIWVNRYSFIGAGSEEGNRVTGYVWVGIVKEDTNGFYIGSSIYGIDYLTGEYNEDQMRGYIGNRIWVASGRGLIVHQDEDEIIVSNFGLLKEKETIIDCEN